MRENMGGDRSFNDTEGEAEDCCLKECNLSDIREGRRGVGRRSNKFEAGK